MEEYFLGVITRCKDEIYIDEFVNYYDQIPCKIDELNFRTDPKVIIDFKERMSGSVNSVSSTVYLLFVIVIGLTFVKPVLYVSI
jgi:hypothetical protein